MAQDEIDDDRRRKDANALAWILSTSQGRRFLGNLIYDPVPMLGGGCGVNQATFSQSHASMAALEGARDVSARLLACVRAVSFEANMQIQAERYQDAQNDAELRERADAQPHDAPGFTNPDSPPPGPPV